MGLDISVYKILKKGYKDCYYFSLIDDDGNYKNNFPEWTKQYERQKTLTWYDWNKYKEQTGVDINECSWHGESYGEDGCFMWLWPNSAGKHPELQDFKIDEDENGPKYDWEKYEATRNAHLIKVDLKKVPTYKKKIKILWKEEVGYQRKGLNHKFYDDYKAGKIGYFVWNKADLERYLNEYCDEPYQYTYPNGEVTDTMIYPKDNFKKNIIDKFIEGECCVTFDW